jgi:hypothetical protein
VPSAEQATQDTTRQQSAVLLVLVYSSMISMTSARLRSATSSVGAVGTELGACEVWPDQGQEVLLPSRHHAGAPCMPLLTCRWHQGWADTMASQYGWAPEAG